MKLEHIHIDNLYQFQNFDLDLTYPEGHAKAGEPLDKICFIGQSGIGKTTLLRITYETIFGLVKGNWKHLGAIDVSKSNEYQNGYFKFENFKFVIHFCETDDASKKIIPVVTSSSAQINDKLRFVKFIFLSHILHGIENLTPQPFLNQKNGVVVTQNDIENQKKARKNSIQKFKSENTIHSDMFKEKDFWLYILEKLDNFDDLAKQKGLEFVAKAISSNVEKLIIELNEWKKNNPNPRVALSEKLNWVLEKFNVKIDTEWAEGGIKIQHSDGIEIPLSAASSGTQKIFLTALPLFFMETNDSIILFDEVENSLYPDVQREIIKFYTDLCPNSQFIFATHSPLIASQFEPCERIHLFFDENGYTQFRKGISPEGLTANDLLQDDFDLDELLGVEALKKWDEFVRLGREIKLCEDKNEKAKLINKYFGIGKLYKFNPNETHKQI